MPSTYTTSLKIQEIASGEQSGVWGTTTNTNWTLIEQAVAGVQTVTMANANYTLTNLNGILDESRNAVLVVSGTNSSVFQVIAPLVEKTYTIRNATSGGYAITIGGATGSIVSIPNGTVAQVYCDGSNFYSAQTSSAGNFNVNGNLVVDGSITGTTASFSGAISSVSPSFTGVPTAPTAAPGTNTTQIATTAFVQNVASGLGTMSTQNANAVAITGGTINGVSGTNASLSVGTATNATNATNVSSGGTIASNVTATTQASGTNNTTVATTAFVQTALQIIYPVGSIYSSTVSTNPNTLFGFGTWSAIAAGRVLLGAGGGYTAGSTGGSADAIVVSHTHTATSTVTDPGHSHSYKTITFTGPLQGNANVNYDWGMTNTSSATTGITVATSVASTGSSGTGANLPPYLVVYMWQRTA